MLSKKPGIRSTKQRQAILDCIRQSRTHMTADDIYQKVRESQPNISLGTVYRNLDVLTNSGILAKTVFSDGKARFEFACGDHHHHLVCIGCGDAVDIPVCPVAGELANFIETQQFQASHHHFEIYGYCAGCSKKGCSLQAMRNSETRR